MAQAKRKTATKTANKPAAKKPACRKKACCRTAKCKDITNKERMHIYIVTTMAIIAGILLCADTAMVIVS